MHRNLIVAIGALAGLGWSGGPGPAGPIGQTPSGPPQVTFRLETNYVEVDAFITDKAGKFVRDLSASDFEVLEDGKPQTVETFALVDIPFEQAAPPPADDFIEPGYISNEGGIEGRIYMIVLDTNHVAALRTPKLKQVLRQFVLDNVSRNDKVAVVHMGRTDLSQDFTSNKRLVLQSIDGFAGDKLRSPALSKYDALLRLGGDGRQPGVIPVPRDPEAQRRASVALQTFDAMSRLGDYMAGIQGRRKTMLLVSEGVDLDLNDQIGPRPGTEINVNDSSTRIDTELFNNTSLEAALASQVAGDLQRMVEAATRANIAVYAVDPRGLADPSEGAMEFAGPPGEAGSSFMLPTTALRRELRDSQQFLRDVADRTGGAAIVGTNNFTDGFARIVADSSTYYVLGYRTSPRYDGKFHNITVRVKRPGLEVRARKGYFALKTKPVAEPDVLHQLLTSPMAMPGLTMRVSSTVLRGPAADGLLQFTVEFAPDLPFAEKGTAFANTIELSYLASDLEGKTKATASKTLDMVLRPDGRAAAAKAGLRFATELPLAPGRYQIRLAAKESVGGKAGSLFWDVTVPGYADAPLSMSDLVLSSTEAGVAPTVHDAVTLKALMPVPPTTGRAFSLEDTVTVFAEIYDRTAAPHTVDLSITVKMDDGTEVFSAAETRESTTRSEARGGYAYVTAIPLRDLVPGRFRMTVTATSSAGRTATRELAFTIR